MGVNYSNIGTPYRFRNRYTNHRVPFPTCLRTTRPRQKNHCYMHNKDVFHCPPRQTKTLNLNNK